MKCLRAALFVSLAMAGVCAGAVDRSKDSPKDTALALARRAKHAARSGNHAEAYLLYSEAAALNPKNSSYKAQMEALQSRAALQAKVMPKPLDGPAPVAEHVTIPPELMFDSLTEREMSLAKEMLPPKGLSGKPGRQNFDIRADRRAIIEQVAKAFGLEPVFDGDYQKGAEPIHFQVTDADLSLALHAAEAATDSFVVPVSSKVFLVAQDTPAKRNELEQAMSVSIPVPMTVTPQDLTEIVQVVKQATNVDKLAWNSTDRVIILRDRVSRVLPAQAVLEQLLAYRPEVMIELEFLQVTKSDMATYGFNPTTTFNAYYLGGIQNSVANIASTVSDLLSFGGGRTLIGIGAASVQAMFNASLNTGNSLYYTQARASSGQAANFHVGDRYPIITAGFVGGASQTGSVYTPPPSFTYEDLGVAMKVTPQVHGMEAVSMTIEASFEVLDGNSVNSVPVIGRRAVNTTVRVKSGEWTVIGGMMGKTRSRSLSGFLGLAQIPVFGNLFKQVSTDDEDTQVLIGVRPLLLALSPDQNVHPAIRVGSEARPVTLLP